MHYPVMTERQLAAKWRVSLKSLRRWRSTGEGPAWHKLFRLVRYHDADVLAFEKLGAGHWQALLDKGERVPRAVSRPRTPAEAETPEEIEDHYVSAKELIEATGLPAHIFTDRAQRDRRQVPHVLLVGLVRFSVDAVLEWELTHSVRGDLLLQPPAAAMPEPMMPKIPARAPRWTELVNGDA